jgi:hypothetical protein
VKAKSRRHQVDERRLVSHFAIAEQFGRGDVAATAMGFDATPVINSLKYVFAIFRSPSIR